MIKEAFSTLLLTGHSVLLTNLVDSTLQIITSVADVRQDMEKASSVSCKYTSVACNNTCFCFSKVHNPIPSSVKSLLPVVYSGHQSTGIAAVTAD